MTAATETDRSPNSDTKASIAHCGRWATTPPWRPKWWHRSGPVLVQASGIGAGDRVLDVAAGAGNVAIPAALSGADVIASDLCPELLERGRALARSRGVSLRWLRGQCRSAAVWR